jgi:hypothetical protein
MATSVILAVSPMPSHNKISGTHASDGTARTACNVGSSAISARREPPTSDPSTSASTNAIAKPHATRSTLAPTSRHRRPLCARSPSSRSTSRGPASWYERIAPPAVAAHHAASSASGSTSLPTQRRSCRLRIDQSRDGYVQVSVGPSELLGPYDPNDPGHGIVVTCVGDAVARIGRAFAQLQLRNAPFQMRRIGKQRRRFVRVRGGVLPRALVRVQHDGRKVTVLGEKILANVERTERVEGWIPVQQPRARIELRGRHVRIESGPRVDLSALERRASVGMLQLHDLDVAFVRPANCSERSRKKYGSVPFVAAIFLPRSSESFCSGEFFATTSAVHSGCEYRKTVLIGEPLARASNAALPAVEPNWIESAARNEFALFEPSESTQVDAACPRLCE